MLSRSSFYVTMASRFEIVHEENIEEVKTRAKMKHEEKDIVLEERFQKVGFQKLLKTRVILILNFTRPHAIK